MQNESVVFGQRERIGGQLVQRRIAELKWGLHIAALPLLAQDISDVVGAEGARRVGLGQGGGDGLGAVLANQREQFADLPR